MKPSEIKLSRTKNVRLMSRGRWYGSVTRGDVVPRRGGECWLELMRDRNDNRARWIEDTEEEETDAQQT